MRMLQPPWPLCASLRADSGSSTQTLSPSWAIGPLSRVTRGRTTGGFGGVVGLRVADLDDPLDPVDNFFIGTSWKWKKRRHPTYGYNI